MFHFIQNYPLLFLEKFLVKTMLFFSLEWDGFFWNFQTPETFAQGVHSLQMVKRSPALAPVFLLPFVASAGLMVLGLWGLKQAYALPQRPLLVALIGAWIVVQALFHADARYHSPLHPY